MAYSVINGTKAQLSDVDGAGTNVDSLSAKDGITLTDAQVAALCGTSGVAVMSDRTGVAYADQLTRTIFTASMYDSA